MEGDESQSSKSGRGQLNDVSLRMEGDESQTLS